VRAYDGVIEAHRSAEGDIYLQYVHEARRVDLHLVLLREVGVMIGEDEEFVSVVLDGARATK
jgi:hypothetical protein